MRAKLIELLKNSYAPYSKFSVAAILEMADGELISGVNVENASYGATICAERNAITTAISNGYKKGDFKKIYIMVSVNQLSTPCFLCRQVISEFFDQNDEIVLLSENDEKTFTVKELCPCPFDENDLK